MFLAICLILSPDDAYNVYMSKQNDFATSARTPVDESRCAFLLSFFHFLHFCPYAAPFLSFCSLVVTECYRDFDVIHKPSGWYDAACTKDSDCGQENSECALGRCRCRPGIYLFTSDITCSSCEYKRVQCMKSKHGINIFSIKVWQKRKHQKIYFWLLMDKVLRKFSRNSLKICFK